MLQHELAILRRQTKRPALTAVDRLFLAAATQVLPRPPRASRGTQEWTTFVRNHAGAVLASDFFAVVTATFTLMYGRPHTSLGSGIPDCPDSPPAVNGHRIREGHWVVADPILGGLHHEYRLERRAA